MARFPPADSRFCHEWYFVIRQSELNLHVLSGDERNEPTHGHAPIADVHAVAANFRHALSQDGDGNRDGVPEVAPPFSQNQSRSEEHTSELQSLRHLVCRLLLEKKKQNKLSLAPICSETIDVWQHVSPTQ